METRHTLRRSSLVLSSALALLGASASPAAEADCNRVVHAEVFALDQPFLWNRLGASEPAGMMYALKGDVVSIDRGADLKPGRVALRPGKRPRPLVLRANIGDCLRVRFTNLLTPTPPGGSSPTRYAGVHVTGMDLVGGPGGAAGKESDGSWVGANKNSLAAPGETKIYEYHAKAEGTFLLYSAGDNVDDQGPGSPLPTQAGLGLFGAVNVQPEWAEWYRSQVTHDDLVAATLEAKAGPAGAGAAESTAPREVGSPKQMTIEPQRAGGRPRMMSVEGKERQVVTLVTPIPDKHTVNRTDAVVVDGRLYTPLLQPLINYHAVYGDGPRQGVPVLKMLKAVVPEGAAPVFTTAADRFTNEDLRAAVAAFNSQKGEATEALRREFSGRNIVLSPRTRVTGEGANSWLLTSPGRTTSAEQANTRISGTFLVRLADAPGGGKRFEVYNAELHIVHSDLTAMITGPNADRFPFDINSPSFFSNPVLPDRRQPYREFTIVYHFATGVVQAFPQYYNKNTSGSFGTVTDRFAINYGIAGIGSEILANRLGVGPMGNPDAVDLKYEEFFLSSWAVGDPAMVVDVPANSRNQAVASPEKGAHVEQQLLFTVDVTADDRTIVELNNSTIDAKLTEGFSAHGVTLSGTVVATTVVGSSQWVVFDNYDANQAPPSDRRRFPIVATGSKTVGGKTTTTLSVYSGFPTNPNAIAFNSNDPKPKATKAFFPDDPSNVYHSNIRDHVKFRILHAGPGPSHVHHLHAHQWLHSPGSPQSQYLDSQLIIPGSAYTLDILHDGTGNRNLTVGDSIFHCHFYPHFAQGMWSLWRAHDVLETGTRLDPEGRPVTHVTDVGGREVPAFRLEKDGKEGFFVSGAGREPVAVDADKVRAAWNRALPDGEIEAGTPIPAIVPLPSLAMPLLPAEVRLTNLDPVVTDGSKGQGRRVEVKPNAEGEYDNPGYPFFIPGVAGHRAPHPPMDFARQKYADGTERTLDGGLPRHVVLGGKIVKEYHTRWDFTRDFIEYDKDQKPVAGKLTALKLPEEGTPLEQAAMRHHSRRTHRSYLPDNNVGNITRNGLRAKPGAPYAPPEVDDYGNAEFNVRRYQAAVIQTDVVLNKQGWHSPQQRFLTLWEDVAATNGGGRPPQPFFFRSNTNDTIEFWHTNLVPSYYELDDFQVRTPTDVIGQHIHNVKFDVTSSDGGANGFNYEDATFSPDEVRDRINALMRPGDPVSSQVSASTSLAFETKDLPALAPQTVKGEPTWGTAPQDPGTVIARSAVRDDARIGSTLGFFCSQHGRMMSGSLVVKAAGVSPKSVAIEGVILNGTPTWVVGNDPADKVEVGPGDSLVWKAKAGKHGVVFDGEGLLQFDDHSGFVALRESPEPLKVVPVRDAYPKRKDAGDDAYGVFGRPPAGQDWNGAQTTIQRWDADSLLDNYGEERTLRTIFTHDHLGASTHQQVGLYAGLVVEPENSLWYLPTGLRMNTRTDGGPTSWEGYVRTQQAGSSYREFLIEFQDTQLAYQNTSRTTPSNTLFDSATSNASAAFDVGQFSDLARQQLAAFQANLNKKVIPDAFRNQIFPGMGVPLSPKAEAKVVTADESWRIEEPEDAPINAGAVYEIRLTGKAPAVSMKVYTPTIHAGWADPGKALNPPSDGNNNGNGAPFAQLISSGAVGTYTMNYRNEPLLTRVSPPASGVAPKPNATDLGFAFNSIPRNVDALNVQPVPGSPIDSGASSTTSNAVVEVTGSIASGRPVWLVDGQSAADVMVRPGDTVVWKAVTGTHGVVFDTELAARSLLDFQADTGLPPLGPRTVGTETVWGTAPVAPGAQGAVLARAVVRRAAPAGTKLGFFCSQHGRAMSGGLTAPGDATQTKVEIDGVIVNGTTPTWVVNNDLTKPATTVVLKPGDTVVWKAVAATHGVVFDTEAKALAFLEFNTNVPVPLGTQVVRGENVWGTAPLPPGTLLAEAKVKANVPPGTTLGFFCSQHGRAMSGGLTASGDATQTKVEIDGVIVNGTTPTWVVNNDLTKPATTVVLKPGDTVVWKAVAATHGVVFDTEAKALAFLEFNTNVPVPLGTQVVRGENVWGTAPLPPGTLLAEAKVKANVPPGTTLGFFCSQHGRAMGGALSTTAAGVTADVEVDGDIINNAPAWTAGGQPAGGVTVKSGDTIIWRAIAGTHGVLFDTEAKAKAFLDFETGGGLPPLGPQTVGSDSGWGTAALPPGSVLARAKVKPGLAPGASLGFFCTRHGRAMSGALATVTAVAVEGLILNGKPTWVVGGSPATDVPLRRGDTVVFKASAGTHGVVFDTEPLARAVFDFETGGGLPVLGPQTVGTESVWGTAPQPPGTVIARAKVKADLSPSATLGFFCSQHGRMMSGRFGASWFFFPPYLTFPSTAQETGGVEPTDPFTPLMRAYSHDEVQVRVLVGAHTQAHSFQMHGLRWEFEPGYLESGMKNAQAMGISEHYEMLFRLPPNTADHAGGQLPFADYFVSPSSSVDGLANGAWSILRAYSQQVGPTPTSKTYLNPLPNNPLRELPGKQKQLADHVNAVKNNFAVNRLGPNYKRFRVHATTIYKALADRPAAQRFLSFNPRFSATPNPDHTTYDLDKALIYVRDEDLEGGKTLKRDVALEPLILRVAAGDWVEITLVNDLVDDPLDPALQMNNLLGTATPFGTPLPNISLATSRQAGLHPALVGFDVTEANGVNVGFNPKATVDAGQERKFYWYAGDVSLVPAFDEDGKVTNLRVAETPIEYGATNLVPGDLMVQPQFGMVGALVVEPEGSTWVEDTGTRASATVTPRVYEGRPFRDFVMVVQNLVANNPTRWGAINYRSETFAARLVDPVAADSRANAESVLAFQTEAGGQPLLTLKPRVIQGENVWGTSPQTPPGLIAQATVKSDAAAGTSLGFFCSQHGPAMSGSLAVQAAGGAAAVVEIDGDIVEGVPTWTFNNQPAANVPVKPGDTVVWKARAGKHGVVFDAKPLGVGYSMAFANHQLLPAADPETPVFRAAAGDPVRFRLVMPSTSTSNALVPPVTFNVHGHGWPEEPYARRNGQPQDGSYEQAFNPNGLKIGRNVRSQFLGGQQVAPYEAFNFVVDHAGGIERVEGDYLYEALQHTRINGLWGLLRVEKNLLVVTEMSLNHGKLTLRGVQHPTGDARDDGGTVTVRSTQGVSGTAPVKKGSWSFSADYTGSLPLKLSVSSSLGGGTTVEFTDPSALPRVVSVEPPSAPTTGHPAPAVGHTEAPAAHPATSGGHR